MLRKLSEVTYEIQDSAHRTRQVVHLNRLKPAYDKGVPDESFQDDTPSGPAIPKEDQSRKPYEPEEMEDQEWLEEDEEGGRTRFAPQESPPDPAPVREASEEMSPPVEAETSPPAPMTAPPEPAVEEPLPEVDTTNPPAPYNLRTRSTHLDYKRMHLGK